MELKSQQIAEVKKKKKNDSLVSDIICEPTFFGPSILNRSNCSVKGECVQIRAMTHVVSVQSALIKDAQGSDSDVIKCNTVAALLFSNVWAAPSWTCMRYLFG